MRNKNLTTLVKMSRMEGFRSTSEALGQNERETLVHLINRMYEWLYFDYEWPFLKTWADKELQAGQQFYDCPEEIDLERLEAVYAKYGDVWVPLDRGLDIDHMNELDSDTDERSDPPQRYDIRDIDGDAQIVIWPIPATDTMTLRIVGRRKFVRLVSDSDICLLDDTLISMFVGAELAAQDKNPRASGVQTAGERRYRVLKYGFDKNHQSKFNFRGSPEPVDHSKVEIRVAHVPSSS